MNYLNKAILKKNEEHWITLRDADYIKNLDASDIEELQKVYQQEVDANFFVNKWCNSCVAEMIRTLYLATEYDKQEEVIVVEEEVKEEVQKTTRKSKK
jgi:thiol-disulfide isomerase/thioredoxin